MRTFIQRYGIWIVVACFVVCISLALLSIKRTQPRQLVSGDLSMVFLVDEETGEETSGPYDVIPPLVGKGGKNTVVQAIKVDFVGERAGVKTVYLVKYNPDVQEQVAALPPHDTQRQFVMDDGRLVRLPAPGRPWVLEKSPEGQTIISNINPGGLETRQVFPVR